MDPTSSDGEESYGANYSEVDAAQMPTEADANLISTIRNTVTRSNTERPVGPPILDEEYPMNHKERGLALIFNHWTYKDKNIKERNGADIDSKALVTEFERLGFKPTVHDNYHLKTIRERLEQVREMDHKDADCLAIVVMTHGKSSELHAFDEVYPDKMLWEFFTGEKCPTLRGKPKLFFIQACRGDSVDDGVKLNAPRTQTDGKPTEKTVTYTIPNTADLLIAHATFDGYYAWRNANSGSWFIHALCNELRLHGTEHDILRLMTAVNRRVAINYQSYSDRRDDMNKKKQMSTTLSTLTRMLYFTPNKATN